MGASFTAATTASTYGTLVINTDGDWTYTLDNADTAVQALPDGATLSDAITVTSAGGDTHNITITINGTDDAASIGGVDTGSVTEDTTLSVSDSLTISDTDTGEASFTA